MDSDIASLDNLINERFQRFMSQLSPETANQIESNLGDTSSSMSSPECTDSDLENFVKVSKALIDSDDSSGDCGETAAGGSSGSDFLTKVKSEVKTEEEEAEKPKQALKPTGIIKKSKKCSEPLGKDHVKVKKSPPKKQCGFCGKLLRSNYLNDHIKSIHLGIKRFTCDFCLKSKFYKSDLKKHLMTHLRRHIRVKSERDRSFKCEFEGCNKSFCLRSSLRIHIIVHSGNTKIISPSSLSNYF